MNYDLQLTAEKNSPDPDGEEIVIEARVGEKYNMYWYLKNTKIEDGKKVQRLCKKLAEEFDLQGLFPKESKTERLKCTY